MYAIFTAVFRDLIGLAALGIASSVLLAPIASAQFGFPGALNLPENDFTWTWGNRRGSDRGFDDFSVLGSEAGFRCDLRGKLRAGGMGSISRFDIRNLENELRGQMRFISAASNRMSQMEAQGALQWATLECVKPKRED